MARNLDCGVARRLQVYYLAFEVDLILQLRCSGKLTETFITEFGPLGLTEIVDVVGLRLRSRGPISLHQVDGVVKDVHSNSRLDRS